ncbi:hypothetical protein AMAG_16009 [Allomyces macrogynus ATCC 38327]|uniref:Fungal lipase-type domain-containing protein n=1 Tax=Allomyces macrogynus (strain ATCC 38327) TaxID=578462 RepID=A0A0L0TBI2_ALLM3|nr:hypothetical protein AMAG_16009 [Allomyces macrogynus ATCC 38327]|eukprot:KNE72071.1 hypothetical protein AMAG_16009 [Allomyces macrogynus ATCC 38327]
MKCPSLFALIVLILGAILGGIHGAAAIPATVHPATSANATNQQFEQDLTAAGKLLSPGLDFDYASLAGDLWPAQAKTLRDIMGLDTSDEAKTARLETAHAKVPANRPVVTGAPLAAIKTTAVYAAAIYCGTADVLSAWRCGRYCNDPASRDTTVVRVLESGDTRAFVAVRGGAREIIVVFRGSVTADNWLKDFDFVLVAYPYARPPAAGLAARDVRVHRGFVQVYEAVRHDLLATIAVTAQRYPHATIIFTGHSLGAAVTTLAAADAATAVVSPSRVHLLNFASPRVGNADFSAMVGTMGMVAVDRFTEGNDLVPHVPLMAFGYWHVAGEKYAYMGQIYACVGSEDQECSDGRVPFLSYDVHSSFLGQRGYFGDVC